VASLNCRHLSPAVENGRRLGHSNTHRVFGLGGGRASVLGRAMIKRQACSRRTLPPPAAHDPHSRPQPRDSRFEVHGSRLDVGCWMLDVQSPLQSLKKTLAKILPSPSNSPVSLMRSTVASTACSHQAFAPGRNLARHRARPPNYPLSTLNPINQQVSLHNPLKLQPLPRTNRARSSARSEG